ncbi:MAG: L-rhamnose mutarotase [Hyphomonas sp.]
MTMDEKETGMERKAWIIRLKPEKIEEYKKLHANAWPSVLSQITTCNIRNYSIFLREPENLLVGMYEYHGIDLDADMKRMGEDPDTKRWWALTDPCQTPLDSAEDSEWWAPMEEVFRLD